MVNAARRLPQLPEPSTDNAPPPSGSAQALIIVRLKEVVKVRLAAGGEPSGPDRA